MQIPLSPLPQYTHIHTLPALFLQSIEGSEDLTSATRAQFSTTVSEHEEVR